MDSLLKKLLENVDKDELLNELKNDKDFNRIMGLMREVFGDGVPTIKIELKPNDDGETHSLSVALEGTNNAIIVGLAEIVANVMVQVDNETKLRADAYDNFIELVKEDVKKIKKEEK